MRLGRIVTPPAPRARIRPRYRWLAALLLVVLPVVVAGPWMYVRLATADDLYGPGDLPEHADAALVLGAKVGDDGEPSVFLRERVETAAGLYEAGVVDTLVMTGATHPERGYDEPATMRDLAIALGVPDDAILLDREGWDTFDSCANARDALRLTSVIVVTQEFHAPRATWLCQQAGMRAEASYPPIGARAGTLTGNVRELGATWKAVLNVWGGRA